MSEFSAEASNLGYLYQIRYALYQMLLMDDESEVILESLDDVAFVAGGATSDLIQLKHHIRKASLTDMSPDLWKSLRIWSDYLLNNQGDMPNLHLITTAYAPDDSAASLLRAANRNEEKALQLITTAANQSTNKSLEDCFHRFKELDGKQKQLLVSKLYVLDLAPDIIDIQSYIRKRIKWVVRPQHWEPFYERLEGWWLQRALKQLAGIAAEPISNMELHFKMSDISDGFEPDALPIDFIDVEPPTPPDPLNDKRIFVQQLHAIDLDLTRIKNAIRDFYKAFEQRSRWAREELLLDGEIESYERKLVEEWQRVALALKDEAGNIDDNESALKLLGKHVYKWMELSANIPIRKKCTEVYITRGSYHMLANQLPPRVTWHPKFFERVGSIIGEVVSE